MTFGITNNNSIVSEWYLNSHQYLVYPHVPSIWMRLPGWVFFVSPNPSIQRLCTEQASSLIWGKRQIHVFMVVRDGCESGCRWFWRFSVFFLSPGNDKKAWTGEMDTNKSEETCRICGYQAIFSVSAATIICCECHQPNGCLVDCINGWCVPAHSASNASFSRAFSPTDSDGTPSNIHYEPKQKSAHPHRTSDNKNNGHDRHMRMCQNAKGPFVRWWKRFSLRSSAFNNSNAATAQMALMLTAVANKTLNSCVCLPE